MKQLSQQEIKQRMIRLQNLERLYPIARKRIENLEAENRSLKQEVASLKEIVLQQQQKIIESLKLQVEELRIIVFGKKKKPKDKNHFDNFLEPKEKAQRSSDSYKRPIPNENEITEVKHHEINTCSCGTKTTYKKLAIFYEEDIPIPSKRIVRKHEVEKSYCPNCQQWRLAIPLPKSKVILGSNIQKYICYLSIFARLSFTQIQNILNDSYQIKISQGEIAKILNREALRLRPVYEQLKKKIRGEPAIHLDETSWKLFIEQEKAFSWVMSGAQSQESVFLVGEHRGKGNVDNLMGKNYKGVVVSDDYGAYRKLKNHQLCWAHLLRKFRDLANSEELEIKQKEYCKEEYQELCLIYQDLKNKRQTTQYAIFLKRLTDFSKIEPISPSKMARLKTTLLKNIPNYLTCLKDANIPLTNNQAERSLRHLVLKRKISFGSLTKRTAENLAVLLSVLMSLRQRYQANFFEEYLKV